MLDIPGPEPVIPQRERSCRACVPEAMWNGINRVLERRSAEGRSKRSGGIVAELARSMWT